MVVSWPPCWVPTLANTLPILLISGAARPVPTALIEKITHLGAHVAEARGCAEDDRVGVGKLVHPRRRNVGERSARVLCAALLEYVVGYELGNLKNAGLHICHFFRTLGYRFGQAI